MGFEECHPSELRRLLGAGLSRRRELLNARATDTIVKKSERKVFLEKAFCSTMLKQTVIVYSTVLSGQRSSHSHPASTVLVPFCL